MNRLRLVLTIASLALLAGPAGAQERGRTNDIPPAYRPPPGMCRIWLDNVPPGQQPAPTDCASAIRNRPSNGRVIFGEELKDKSKKYRKTAERRPGDFGALGPLELGDTRRPRDWNDAAADDESALPAMSGGALFARGIRSPDVLRWLGDDADLVARATDADRDGQPERIVWQDRATGATVQVWTDADRDGRADRVELFRDGRRVRVIGGP